MAVFVRIGLLITGVFLISFQALAALPPDALSCQVGEDYKIETLHLLDALSSLGVSRLGDHPLLEMREELRKLSFECIQEFHKPPQATRFHAFYDLVGHRVLINTHPALQHPVAHMGLLGLHEFLSLHGFQDSFYELSSLITAYVNAHRELPRLLPFYSFYQRTVFTHDLIQELARSRRAVAVPPVDALKTVIPANGLLQEVRSGTLVGGGGDIVSIEVKYHLMRLIIQNVMFGDGLCRNAIHWLAQFKIESADISRIRFFSDLVVFVPKLGAPRFMAKAIFNNVIKDPSSPHYCAQVVN